MDPFWADIFTGGKDKERQNKIELLRAIPIFSGLTRRELHHLTEFIYDRVYEAAGEDAAPVYISSYLRVAGRPYGSGETIALIQGYGNVVRGSSTYSPLDGSVTMGADSIAAAFRSAVEDDRVRAIIFHWTVSPGR